MQAIPKLFAKTLLTLVAFSIPTHSASSVIIPREQNYTFPIFKCPTSLGNLDAYYPDRTISRLEERQPDNFGIQPRFKVDGTSTDKIETLSLLAETTAVISYRWHFDRQLPGFHYFNDWYVVNLQGSGVQAPTWKAKEMMWSLRAIACFMQQQERYAEVSWNTLYTNEPYIGSGQIYNLPTQTNQAQNSSDMDDKRHQSSEIASGAYGKAENEFITAVYQIQFANTGPRIDPYDIFMAIMSAVIAEAERPKRQLRPIISYYNSLSDLSLAVRLTTREGQRQFTVENGLLVLLDVARLLGHVEEAPMGWAEITFNIESGLPSEKVGEGKIAKRRLTGDGTSIVF